MPRCIIISHDDDVHADAVCWGLERLGITASVLHVEHFFERHEFAVEFEGLQKSLSVDGLNVDPKTVFWLRRPTPAIYFERSRLHPADFQYAVNACRKAYDNFLEAISVLNFCISPISAMRRYDSKLLQLIRARDAGLMVPCSLFGNDQAAVIAFLKKRRAVVKPQLPHQWIIEDGVCLAATVSEVSPEDIYGAAKTFRLSPEILQQLLPSTEELRVFVVGQNIFCARLGFSNADGNLLDWRRHHDRLTISPSNLPHETVYAIRRFMAKSGLRSASLDFIEVNDELYFLEANTAGQWLWLNRDDELPLLDCFCKFLAAGNDDYIHDGNVQLRYSEYLETRGTDFIDRARQRKDNTSGSNAYYAAYRTTEQVAK